MENGEPHVRLSKHDSVSMGTSAGSFQTLLGSRRQVTPGELERAVPHARGLRAPAGLMSRESPLPDWVQLHCRRSSLG